MLNKLLSWGLVLLLLAVPWPTLATENQDPIERLLQISGFDEQIRRYPARIKDQLYEEAKAIPISEDQLQMMQNLVDQFVDPDVIIATVRDQFGEVLSDDEVAEQLAWYESDLGLEITLAEVERSSPGVAVLAEQAESLMAESEKVEFAKAVFQITGGTEFVMAVSDNIQLMVILIMAAVLAPGESLDLDAVKAQLAPMRLFIMASAEQIAILSTLYTYHIFSVDELDQYQQFLESPASKKFNDTASAAIIGGFEQYVDDLIEYSKTLKPKRWMPEGAI